MRLSRLFYFLSRTTRDAEVLSGKDGASRLVKRLTRREVTRRLGRQYDDVWRWNE